MKKLFKGIYDAYVEYYEFIDSHLTEEDRKAILSTGHNPYCPWVM